MTRVYFIRLRNFLLTTLAQVLIFSQIHLFGYATAYIYSIFLLKLPRHTTRNELMLWAFIMGLIVDIFANTPGVNSAAATLMAFARGYILESFVQKGTPDDFVPSAATMSWSKYIVYSITSLLFFCTILFLLELFTISYPVTLLMGVGGSTLLTLLFIIATEFFNRK